MSRGAEPDEWLMSQVASDRRDCLAPLVRRYASSLLTYMRRMVERIEGSGEALRFELDGGVRARVLRTKAVW